ncbi:hypothetical protein [Parapedobacter sp. 10938]|uniref:hypothetical protein n=1 Tax=Parapedobacter flavus TaxID=3110225 RepID=UPI002DB819FD|nr:hypothetical protein [Parapedobacter sp. 10938]MEC3879596.1 hypothetical protein [Parapedobacter sp. 10938]
MADLEIVKAKLVGQHYSPIPSPDTVEYVCQQLKRPNQEITVESEVVHQLNHDNRLNGLLVSLALRCNQLNASDGQCYTLDYDNVVIENEKQDARFSYKKTKAYHPGFAFIGRIPVYIENSCRDVPKSFGIPIWTSSDYLRVRVLMEQFRLYYTSASTVSQSFDIYYI